MKKKVLIITTGGTIAMKYTEEEGVVPSRYLINFLNSFPQIHKDQKIDIYEFANIPSPQMTPEKMIDLAKVINSKIDDYDGVVITHGTDTMEETAYLLNLVLDTDKPVILTAAMRNNPELGLDGPRNIVASVRVACAEKAKNMGVLVIMNDEIHSAREVIKADTSKVNAFSSFDSGILGTIDPDKISFYRKLPKVEIIKTNVLEEKVDLLKAVSGMSTHLIDSCIKNKSRGIVIEAFGRGNLPPKIADKLEEAIKKGIIVVVASRSVKGRVLAHYGYEGGGKDLAQRGAILGDDLQGPKARLKLMALFGKYNDAEAVKKYYFKH